MVRPDYFVVRVESGELRGTSAETLLNKRRFYQFRGIPYAEPPIGNLRFKAPVKVQPWDGVKDATEFGPKCIQPDSRFHAHGVIGQEDCLYLNVFTPDLAPKQKLPVIFYIHEGSFMVRSSDELGPDLIMDQDLVVVTINYRLGPFGFLTLNTPEYSGNMGLKDQLLALKWVNENIHHFGGDKNRITLYGHSVGGISANIHMLAPASRGLFQRAILQGGSVLNPYSLSPVSNHRAIITKLVAKERSIREVDVTMDDILCTLESIEGSQLLLETFVPFYEAGTKAKFQVTVFGPVVEDESIPNAFLTKPIESLLAEGSDVDALYGYCSGEALYFISEEINDVSKLGPFDKHFELQLPLPNLTYDCSSPVYKEIIQEVRDFYFNGKPVNKETFPQYVQLLSDAWLIYGIQTSAKVQAKRSSGKTYLNRFSVESTLSYFRSMVNADSLGLRGAAHVEDSLYLFRCDELIPLLKVNKYKDLKPDSIDGILIYTFGKFIANFASCGNPTPNGEPVDAKPIVGPVLNYVDVTNSGLIVGVNPDSTTITFWNNFLKKHKYALNVPQLVVDVL